MQRDNPRLVRAEKNDVRIIRIYPNVLVIVAAGRATPTFPAFAAIGRFPTNHARRVNDLWIFWIESHYRQIAAADAEARARIVGCPAPRFAAVVGAVKFRDRFCSHSGEE